MNTDPVARGAKRPPPPSKAGPQPSFPGKPRSTPGDPGGRSPEGLLRGPGSRFAAPAPDRRGARTAPSPAALRRLGARQLEAAWSQRITHYRSILESVGIADVSEFALHLWAHNAVSGDQLRFAIAIAERKQAVSAGYVARILQRRIQAGTLATLGSAHYAQIERNLARLGETGFAMYAHTRWTKDQDQALRSYVEELLPVQEIGRRLRRTDDAIKSRIVKLYGGRHADYPVYPEPAPTAEEWKRLCRMRHADPKYRAKTLAELAQEFAAMGSGECTGIRAVRMEATEPVQDP